MSYQTALKDFASLTRMSQVHYSVVYSTLKRAWKLKAFYGIYFVGFEWDVMFMGEDDYGDEEWEEVNFQQKAYCLLDVDRGRFMDKVFNRIQGGGWPVSEITFLSNRERTMFYLGRLLNAEMGFDKGRVEECK